MQVRLTVVIAGAILVFLAFFALGDVGGDAEPAEDRPDPVVVGPQPEGSSAPVALGRGPRRLVLPPTAATPTRATPTPAAPAAPARAAPAAPGPAPPGAAPDTPREPAPRPEPEPRQRSFEDVR